MVIELGGGPSYLVRLVGIGSMCKSVARRGGVLSRVGGVELSESPDEPAVEGRVSGTSFFADFFRAGTPSGHVH